MYLTVKNGTNSLLTKPDYKSPVVLTNFENLYLKFDYLKPFINQ